MDMLLLPEGQRGEACGPSEKLCSVVNRGVLCRKLIALRVVFKVLGTMTNAPFHLYEQMWAPLCPANTQNIDCRISPIHATYLNRLIFMDLLARWRNSKTGIPGV